MIARAAKLLLALTAACGALLLGAWAGGAFAGAAQGRPSRAVDELAYERASAGTIAVGDALVVNGQPMQLSLFYTADPPERVVAFYAAAFIARGLTPVTLQGHVSVFDRNDGLQRFITAVPQPDGQTMVLIGVTNPRKAPRLLRGSRAASFPVPEENRAFLGYRSDDASARAETGQFVTKLSTAEVAAFYREALSAQGWQQSESAASMLVFSKRGASLSVALQALEDKAGAAVFVNLLEGDAQR